MSIVERAGASIDRRSVQEEHKPYDTQPIG